MRFLVRTLTAIGLTITLGAASVFAKDFVLVHAGKTAFQIVIPSNAIPSQRYAADELQNYLEKITGAKLPIVTDAARATAREILLGDNAHLRKLGLKIDFGPLGSEGFTIRTDSGALVLAGGKPRGTLYAVYTLLEEKLGVRWLTPELEAVPHTNRILLPEINQTFTPALEYREVYWTEMMRDADFAARHRLNGNSYALKEKHGGRGVVYQPFVHSFDALVPPELYSEHPEYFPLIDGQRVKGYVQRCLSNPEVLKLSIARVRQWIKEHPEATIISISQNDVAKWCQCETCKTLDDAEGSPSASLLRFVNAIAEDIERDFPHVRIDTLAYQYTRKPPKTLRPRHNVIIRLCSIECCFAHPLESCPSSENQRFRDDIAAWEPISPLLYVWNYSTDFGHYQQPFPNFDVLQPNVQFFVKHHVKGLFDEGNYSGGGEGEMGPLRAYLLAKLLWNPETDMKKHTAEFLRAYYGAAAPKLAQYVELLENQVRNGKAHARLWDRPTAAYLNDEFIGRAEELLNQAEQLTGHDPERLRVQVARLPIWYVKLAGNRVTGEARDQLLQHFLQIARKAGISNISEGQGLQQWAGKMEGK